MVGFKSSLTPINQVLVSQASDITGPLDSSKLYLVDGAIDLGDASIDVPVGGLQIAGLGFDISSLTSTGPIFTYSGAYSGDIQLLDLSLTSPSVFDLDNDGNNGAVESTRVNFVSCASLGSLSGYRQGLWSGVGVIFCTDGITLNDTWSGGFAVVDSIIIGGFTGTMLKTGTGLTFGGSIRSNINALGLGSGGEVCDFAPSNILSNGGFVMEDVRVPQGSNAFPNMPTSSIKARFRNCSGTDNTSVGGECAITATGETVISVADTLYEITATGAGNILEWFSLSNTNRLVYDSDQTIRVSVSGALSFTGSNNDEMRVQIRMWDDSASAYVNVGTEYEATLNGGPSGSRGENVSFYGTATMDQNDRIEIWIKNKGGTGNISTVSGLFYVRER